MATVIYNYFSDYHGFVDVNNNEFESKYKSCSAKDLRKVLKKLKCENGDLQEIKFVAKKLRCLLSKITPNHNMLMSTRQITLITTSY